MSIAAVEKGRVRKCCKKPIKFERSMSKKKKKVLIKKLKWNLPWMVKYPFERIKSFFHRTAFEEKHIIFTIADHFEPSWSPNGLLPIEEQKAVLEKYHRLARKTGERLKDADGTSFRHTYFYPAEQYHPDLLNRTAAMQAEGLGEVEVHLHHGVEEPDTPGNLRRQLIEFRDRIADEHKCLSRIEGDEDPKYAFVHGNLALGNSADGHYCGVDNELEILSETGCYVDMTLASAPDISQVPMFNKIYEIGNPLDEPVPHRSGTPVAVDNEFPQLPVIFTGPLVLNWERRIGGVPVPRIDDGALVYNQPMDLARLKRWMNANITVGGRSDWVFVKLYCHGFFEHDQSASIGEDAVRFFSEIVEYGDGAGGFKVHFATAREAANMVFAAIDGEKGDPNDYRNYRLRTIMDEE